MRVRFTPTAEGQYFEALAYLLERSPAAASGLQQRAEAAIAQLSAHPESGHAIPEFPGLPHREIAVEPYRLFHRIVNKTVWIVGVWHGRQLPATPDEPVSDEQALPADSGSR
jgi:plasmid stabilization system protein ParE